MLEAVRRQTSRFGLDIVSINVWEHLDPVAEAQHFCEVHGIQGTVLVDSTGEYTQSLGITGVPFNLLVDAKGIVRSAGVTTPDEMRHSLKRFLLRGR
jgi:hypothetical protein